MQLLDGLLNRVSIPRLQAPGPTPEQVHIMLQAALRAPDHGNLKPWRSIMVAGDARTKLGQVFKQAQLARNPDTDPAVIEKCGNMPMRAPNVWVIVASPKDHPKVPVEEQIQATAAACQSILLAAHAQEIGAVWRTGWVVGDQLIRDALGVKSHEQIIAMLYMGTPSIAGKPVPVVEPSDFIQDWH